MSLSPRADRAGAARPSTPTSHAQPEQQASVWVAGVDPLDRPPLERDTQTEVCVVGAGIAGLTTAYLLAGAGRAVIVLDDKPIAGGQTHRSSAHLSCILDDRFTEIARIHGEAGARAAASSHRAAIDLIEKIVHDEGIECDFQRVDAHLLRGESDYSDLLERERDAAARAGVAVESMTLSLRNGTRFEALRFPGQAQFDPVRYMAGLATAVERRGVRIACGMHVTGLRSGAHAGARCANGIGVGAGSLVVATNTPINDRAVIHTKLAPYTTYVVGIEIARDELAPGLYWDTTDPYHYVRIAPLPGTTAGGGREDRVLLIVGGEDHKTGQAQDKEDRFARLVDWARRTLHLDGEVHFRWSGQVMETLDGLGYLGRNPMDHDNAYIITGDSGMGLTHGTLGAMIVSDQITGVVNPWETLYDPARKPLAALKTFAQENLNVARQLGDWISPGQVRARGDIERGSGAVLRNGIHKEAVYRDEAGAIHRCSAVCPHMGCIVRWNEVEKIWDCPCHGSRFDRYGKVLTGPSRADLDALPNAPD